MVAKIEMKGNWSALLFFLLLSSVICEEYQPINSQRLRRVGSDPAKEERSVLEDDEHRQLGDGILSVLQSTWFDATSNSFSTQLEAVKCQHPVTGETVILTCGDSTDIGGSRNTINCEPTIMASQSPNSAPSVRGQTESSVTSAKDPTIIPTGELGKKANNGVDNTNSDKTRKGGKKGKNDNNNYAGPDLPVCTDEQLGSLRTPSSFPTKKTPSRAPVIVSPVSSQPTQKPISSQVTKPTTKPPVSSQVTKPTTKPPVSSQVTRPTTKPQVSPQDTKPTTKQPISSPVTKPTTTPPVSSEATKQPVSSPPTKQPVLQTAYCERIAQGSGDTGQYATSFEISGVFFAANALSEFQFSQFKKFVQQGVAPVSVGCDVNWATLLSSRLRHLTDSTISSVKVLDFQVRDSGSGDHCGVYPADISNYCASGVISVFASSDAKDSIQTYPQSFLQQINQSINSLTLQAMGLTEISKLSLSNNNDPSSLNMYVQTQGNPSKGPILAVVFIGIGLFVLVMLVLKKRYGRFKARYLESKEILDHKNTSVDDIFVEELSAGVEISMLTENQDSGAASNTRNRGSSPSQVPSTKVENGQCRTSVWVDADGTSPITMDGSTLHPVEEICFSPDCQLCAERRKQSPLQFFSVHRNNRTSSKKLFSPIKRGNSSTSALTPNSAIVEGDAKSNTSMSSAVGPRRLAYVVDEEVSTVGPLPTTPSSSYSTRSNLMHGRTYITEDTVDL